MINVNNLYSKAILTKDLGMVLLAVSFIFSERGKGSITVDELHRELAFCWASYSSISGVSLNVTNSGLNDGIWYIAVHVLGHPLPLLEFKMSL